MTPAHLTVVHEFYPLHPDDKDVFLSQLLDMERPQSAAIFVSSRERATEIVEYLHHRGIHAGEYRHVTGLAGMRSSIRPLRDKTPKYYVIAHTPEEKLKIPSVSHIVHGDVARSNEEYQFRIGACSPWSSGIRSITLVGTDELPTFESWKAAAGVTFDERQPRLFSPHAGHRVDVIEEGLHGGHVVSDRMKQPPQRCEVLDHLGLPPVERTLGSRFASSRRGKRKWEPRSRNPEF